VPEPTGAVNSGAQDNGPLEGAVRDQGEEVSGAGRAAFFFLLRELFSRFFTEYYLIPVGIIFTLMVIFVPQGLLGFLRRRLNQ